MIPVGFALPPDKGSLALLADLIEQDADYYELTPETLWRGDPLEPNGFWRLFAALAAHDHRPVVAHGVSLSPGSAGGGAARRAALLARIAADHAQLRFGWYTDHLGASVLDGLQLALPCPVPMIPAAAATLRARLAELQRIVPDVGVESTCNYATFGHPLDEPAFLRAALDRPRTWLLLDLHNVWTMGQNLGFDPLDWIGRAPLEKVIEIHVSGGSESDPRWLPDGRILRLDSHDGAVPEPVWALLERVAPRCPNLRGITLERMEGTVQASEVGGLRSEMARIRDLARTLPDPCEPPGPPPVLPLEPLAEDMDWEVLLARAWLAPDPVSAFGDLNRETSLPEDLRTSLRGVDADGIRISALLISKLRFERLLHGSRTAVAALGGRSGLRRGIPALSGRGPSDSHRPPLRGAPVAGVARPPGWGRARASPHPSAVKPKAPSCT